MKYVIEPLTKLSALEAAARILPCDWEECEAWTGMHPGEALVTQASLPDPSFVVYRKSTDEPLVVMGASPNSDGTCYLWMMATDALRISDATFILNKLDEGVAGLLGEAERPAPFTLCMASEDNILHRRWLDRAGFVPTGRTEDRRGVTFQERMYVSS